MKKITLPLLFASCLLSAGSVSATPFSIEMVADNDFAIFSGTSTGINNLLYQNNVDWYAQVASISTLSFNLAAGDDTFYVLGMGGGGPQENISGLVNGVNMTDPSLSVSMSSDISSFLPDYNFEDSVAKGSYSAQLIDVQNAFSQATWSNASSNLNTTQTVIHQAGFGAGYRFNTGTAHLFSFDAVDVNVEPVSAPASLALFSLSLAGLAYRRRKHSQK